MGGKHIFYKKEMGSGRMTQHHRILFTTSRISDKFQLAMLEQIALEMSSLSIFRLAPISARSPPFFPN
jgi:hypothetical protein